MVMVVKGLKHIASKMDGQSRKILALKSLNQNKTVVALAKENNVSRQFIHTQKKVLLQTADEIFSEEVENNKILFYLPVTKEWLEQFSISLVLDCRSTFRGVIKAMNGLLDYSISLGNVSSIIKGAIKKAIAINDKQDLTHVKLGAHDEIFHQNNPVLAGVDIA